MTRSYSNERIDGTLDVLGKLYGSVNSLLALGAVVGDSSTVGATPSGSPSTGVGDKIDLYNGLYGFGLQAARIVAYVPAGSGFSVRANTVAGQRSAGTDAVTLFADGTVTGSVLKGTAQVMSPYLMASSGNGPYVDVDGTHVQVVNRTTASNIALMVSGMAGQTGDLQRWLAAAGGTVVGTMSAAGALTAAASVNAPIVNSATSPIQQLSVTGFNPNAVMPTAVGGRMGADCLRWKTPTVIEVASSATAPAWTTTGAPTAATVANALCGRYDLSGPSLTSALPALRLTFTGFNATYFSHLLVAARYGPSSAVRVLVEMSPDGVTWTSRGDTVTAMDLSNRWTVLPLSDIGSDQIRITFLMTTYTNDVPLATIQAISTRPGDQGPNGTNDLTYTWDSLRNTIMQGKLWAPNRLRAGFNANTQGNYPLTPSALEAEVSSNSMLALGEGTAGDANPGITLYRTAAGLRSGRAFRMRMAGTGSFLLFEYGGSNVAYGSETYTQAAQMGTDGSFGAASVLGAYTGATAQMRLVGSTASGAPTSGTFAVGDLSYSRADGRYWSCIAAGTPGTWVPVGQEELAYVTASANTAAITTVETVTDTVTLNLVNGRSYDLDYEGFFTTTVAGDYAQLRLREDSVTGTTQRLMRLSLPTVDAWSARFTRRYVATATGSKTFVVTGLRVAGTGNVVRLGAVAGQEPRLTVTDVT